TLSAAHQVRRIVRGRTFEKRQHWHWALLRMRDERPSGYTTTNSFDEIAASHCPARGLGPRQSCDYIRDLRWGEWGQIIILRGNNPQERMSALGQKQTSRHLQPMSALPPKADIDHDGRDVCFVPEADIPPFCSITITRAAHAFTTPIAKTYLISH